MLDQIGDDAAGLAVSRAYLHPFRSWLNQVERWFASITIQAIRRASFDSVPDLKPQELGVDAQFKGCLAGVIVL